MASLLTMKIDGILLRPQRHGAIKRCESGPCDQWAACLPSTPAKNRMEYLRLQWQARYDIWPDRLVFVLLCKLGERGYNKN